MKTTHPINQTLLTVVANQRRRTEAALEDLDSDVFTADPGGGCHCIRDIGRHLVMLRRFQLMLMGSPLVEQAPDHESIDSVGELRGAIDAATDLLEQAISEHDPSDWYAVPDPPREGKWGDELTIVRLTRPLNDFVNHLGAIRAIRRIMGNAVERTQ